MEERKNNNTGLIVLVTVLVMLVLGLVGFIVYDKILKDANEPNVEENNNEETNNKLDESDLDEKETIENVSLSDEDKINYNTQIKTKLERYFINLLNLEINKNIKYNQNYLESPDAKIYLAWELVLRDDKISKNDNIGESGIVATSIDDYEKKYKAIFDEEIKIQTLSSPKLGVIYENGYVYGPSSGYVPEFSIKINSHSINNDTNTHELVFDFITKFDSNMNIDLDVFSNCIEPSVINYPQEVVYAKMKIELQKNVENYIFKSIVFEK